MSEAYCHNLSEVLEESGLDEHQILDDVEGIAAMDRYRNSEIEILKSPEKVTYSVAQGSESLVIFRLSPFVTAADRDDVNEKIRTQQQSAEDIGFVDEHGIPPTVITIAAPTMKTSVPLNYKEHQTVKNGDLDPYVAKVAKVVLAEQHRGTIAEQIGLVIEGHSFGGFIAPNLAMHIEEQEEYEDVSVIGVITTNTPASEPSSRVGILGDLSEARKIANEYGTRNRHDTRSQVVKAMLGGFVDALQLEYWAIWKVFTRGEWSSYLDRATSSMPKTRFISAASGHDPVNKGEVLAQSLIEKTNALSKPNFLLVDLGVDGQHHWPDMDDDKFDSYYRLAMGWVISLTDEMDEDELRDVFKGAHRVDNKLQELDLVTI